MLLTRWSAGRSMHPITSGADLMNADILAGKWKQLKGRVKQQWADMTHDDLAEVQGNYESSSV